MKSLAPWLQSFAFVMLAAFFCVVPTAWAESLKPNARQHLGDVTVHLGNDERAWLVQKKTLIVGVTGDPLPPYRIFTEHQGFEGLTADYLMAMERELGVTITVHVFDTADALYAALNQGQVDLVGSATAREAREFGVQLTPPYIVTELALFSESGNLYEYSTDDPHTRIAAANEVAVALYKSRGGQGAVTLLPSPLAAMASVLAGDADVYLGDTLSTAYLSSKLFNNQLVVNQSARLPDIEVGFAFTQPILGRLFERALKGISQCQIAKAQYFWGDMEPCDLSDFRSRLTDAELTSLNQMGEVELAISEDLAPYAFFNNHGRFNGIASDLLDIIRRKTGIRFNVARVSSLSDADELLSQGEAGVAILPEIGRVNAPYLQTRAMATEPYLFVMRQDDHVLLDAKSTATVAVAKGYLLPESLSGHYPDVQIEQTSTMGEAFKRVRDGDADFALAPTNIAHYYLSYKYESSLKVGGILDSQDSRIVFAVPKDRPELASILNKAMLEIPPRDYLQIVGRWRANSATDNKYWEGIAIYIWRSFETLGALLLVAALFIVIQRRRIERKRRDLRERQMLLDELQVSKEAAEKASRSKTVFLATMSHEIRTPLNAIIGMLELVLTRKDNAELNAQSVHIAYESATHLLSLIGDILDISRIESGKLSLMPEPIRIKALLESVSHVFSGLARQKQLYLRLDIDSLASEWVWGDGLKIKQILSNLLSNAIKFTEHGGIEIRCNVEPKGETTLSFTISVSDTGVGIPHAQISQIFKPFYVTSDAVSDPNAGAGLGLAICKELSELMGGRLEVASEVDHGTRLTLHMGLERISADSATADMEPNVSLEPSQNAQLTILIVEDHLPSQYLLYQQTAYLGHRALTASNGLEGIAMWQENQVDIVITDCNMPLMDGHEMTRCIRRLEQAQGLRPCVIIGLTADAQREELEHCLASGMNHALAKPINLAGLNRLIPMRAIDDSQPTDAASRMNDIQAAMSEQIIQSNNTERVALLQALADADVKLIKRIAHKLKGTAYLLNLPRLLEQCSELNERCSPGQMSEDVHNATTALIQTLEHINQSLQVD